MAEFLYTKRTPKLLIINYKLYIYLFLFFYAQAMKHKYPRHLRPACDVIIVSLGYELCSADDEAICEYV